MTQKKVNKNAGNTTVFQEIEQNWKHLQDIQLNEIYPAIKGYIKIDWDEKILKSKMQSEKILYFLGKNDLELRTLKPKNKLNFAGIYIQSDGRTRFRFSNTKKTNKVKKWSTVGHIIGLIKELEKSKKYSKKATRNTIKDSVRLHGHHLINKTVDRFDAINGLWDTKHIKLHRIE